MIVVKCEISDAHHAIYRDLNQITATKLRIGVYTFDTRGCKYPDRTMSSLPIDVQQIRDRLQVNKSILDPIYIDNKEDRVRTENRPHLLRTKGGYPVERVVGIVDIPVYNELNKVQRILSTTDRPSGQLLEFNQSSVFERLGTRSTQLAMELKLRDDKLKQVKPKPPNYSRISSTLKLFQPTAFPSSQRPQPISSYASAVKRNLNINLSTAPRPTTKSTSDIQNQQQQQQQVVTEPKVPFKLVPVMPPTKTDAAKSGTTTSAQSKSIHKGRAKIKSKIRSLINRSLSPVHVLTRGHENRVHHIHVNQPGSN